MIAIIENIESRKRVLTTLERICAKFGTEPNPAALSKLCLYLIRYKYRFEKRFASALGVHHNTIRNWIYRKTYANDRLIAKILEESKRLAAELRGERTGDED